MKINYLYGILAVVFAFAFSPPARGEQAKLLPAFPTNPRAAVELEPELPDPAPPQGKPVAGKDEKDGLKQYKLGDSKPPASKEFDPSFLLDNEEDAPVYDRNGTPTTDLSAMGLGPEAAGFSPIDKPAQDPSGTVAAPNSPQVQARTPPPAKPVYGPEQNPSQGGAGNSTSAAQNGIAPGAFAPVMAGVAPLSSGPTDKLPVPLSTPMLPLPGVPDIAVILANNQFFPSRIRLKEGMQTRLIFTTVNRKPAALVLDRLQIQRWLAREDQGSGQQEDNDRSKVDINREVSMNRVTEIVIDPKRGIYSFHDAITGASGEITVE